MRYHPHTKQDREEMLAKVGTNAVGTSAVDTSAVGAKGVDAIFLESGVPKKFLNPKIDLPKESMGEMEVAAELGALATKNKSTNELVSFLGAGYYKHHIPSTVDHIIQRSEFLTAYTPYQPEVSQGTLTAIFEFQSYICALTGQEVANASMYDGATATAEAALMARRVTKRPNIAVSKGLNPTYLEVLETYLSDIDAEIVEELDETCAAFIIQNPDYFGECKNLEAYRKQCDKAGALLVCAVTEIVSLGLLPAPKCADIVCGEAQSLGNPLSFGGPSLGFFATKEKYLRQIPGRICGQTEDRHGRSAYTLTLNTREQHIRREKATSNICTNEGLCALAFTIHLSLLGEEGFKQLASLNHAKACALADKLEKVKGVKVLNDSFFNEFVVEVSKPATKVLEALLKKGILGGVAVGEKQILLAVTECTSEEDMDRLYAALKKV